MELPAWREHGVIAGITTRDRHFNLGLSTAEPADQVLARWRSLLAAFRPDFRAVQLGLQVHGTQVASHDAPATGWTIHEATDGHATRQSGVLLCVTVADCIPVFLLHPPTRTVGLLHAGWRGTASGILERGVASVALLARCHASDVIMHCGVGICGSCYEVGPEVTKALHGVAGTDRSHVDLRAELTLRAHRSGLHDLTVSGWCSAHDDQRFFSHRRSGGTDGRMVAYVGVPGA